jgi:glycosyl hydrolase family 141
MLLIFICIMSNYNIEINSDSIVTQKPLLPLDQNSIMTKIYVSPTGNDSADGSKTTPYCTIKKAQGVVRSLIPTMTGDIEVILSDGVFQLADPLTFNSSDGGTTPYSVKYLSESGTSPKISGGQSITGWKHQGNNIWYAPSPLGDFRQLYVNGKRAIRARGDPINITSTDGDGHETSDKFMKNWRNLQDVEFVYRDIWTLPRVRPFLIKDEFIYMQQPAYSFIRYKPDSQNQAPAWIENAYELLDEPGEWYLDKKLDTVYYMPLTSETLNTSEIIAPNLEVILNISGNAANPVKNLYFSNITFEHGSWLTPNQFGFNCVEVQANVIRVQGSTQWTSQKSPGNIICQYAQNLHFKQCNFTRMGTGAIDIKAGVKNSSLIGCKISDISGIAIQMGEVTDPLIAANDPRTVSGINIINNYIVNCSQEFMSGPGIFTGYVRNIRIEHNNIANLPYTGISCGWGWSARETVCANNSIKFNHIYGVMNFLRDGGGIYTLSTQPGTNVSYNVIHDSGWNGLYPDERTNQTTWSYNVVYDTYDDFLDHSMYEESKWNDVHHNYLEDYPRHLWVWYPDRDEDQIWGLKPGDSGFPADIVQMAGVQAPYKYLIPNNEQYWHYSEEFVYHPIANNPTLYWGLVISISVVGIIGLTILILKTKVHQSIHVVEDPQDKLPKSSKNLENDTNTEAKKNETNTEGMKND